MAPRGTPRRDHLPARLGGPGCLARGGAEITPVEPDPGHAGEGSEEWVGGGCGSCDDSPAPAAGAPPWAGGEAGRGRGGPGPRPGGGGGGGGRPPPPPPHASKGGA